MTADDHGRGLGRATRGADRRAGIVQAALEVIAERGYRGAALAAVAERVGLTQQGLLHYFPTKEALLIAVLDARDQWDMASAALHGTAWPLEMIAGLVEYNATRPGVVQVFTVLAGDSVTEDHPASGYFKERYARVREWGAQSLRSEYGDVLPGGLTPEQAAPLLVAVMDGLQTQWLHDPEAVDMPAAFRDFVALLTAPRAPDGTPGGA
ncbi:TetR/AcrR family transcriptional regulator [Streptomyces sp. NPDC088354]|uniref:TetR/AcrR family transcriptional regulator n=1 Tax=unclassified Streptomyces TaxID=2593676 RepID=UPI0029BBE590|nr:TetR/AcrR family transcriptional regulator [Streptomyces sp. MI02-7b]MDX3075722.1 TetR/AcrR family transcriptional regulator [Streptomyces sp. MI02-7b]